MERASNSINAAGIARPVFSAALRPCFKLFVAAFLWLFPLFPLPARAQTDGAPEYKIKAAFLYHFAQFAEWPANAFPNVHAPINICVYGYDPFGASLDEILQGKTINNRPLQARRVNDLPDLKSCHLVFVSSHEDKHLPEILEGLHGVSTLLVGETSSFAEHGGGLQFYLENNKVRFCANLDALQRARLTVSSKLLTLAKITHDDGHPRGI